MQCVSHLKRLFYLMLTFSYKQHLFRLSRLKRLFYVHIDADIFVHATLVSIVYTYCLSYFEVLLVFS